ncbi:hypothetical protein ACFLYB_01360 [Chloroflexota bacterium]
MNHIHKILSKTVVLSVLCSVLILVTLTACSSTSAATDVVTTDQPTQTTEPASNENIDLMGTFTTDKSRGPAGAEISATGTGFEPSTNVELLWQKFDSSWKVEGGEYFGREVTWDFIPIANTQTDSQGNFQAAFTVPSPSYGYNHDLLVVQNGVTKNKLGFHVDLQVSISPSSGPVGTPITIEIEGLGWADMENNRMVQYDNSFVGFMSAVSTHGHAKAVITATGTPGKHFIKVLRGVFTFPYMNPEESPFVSDPHNIPEVFEFTMTDGPPVLPGSPDEQRVQTINGTRPAVTGEPQIWTDPVLAPVGTPMTISGVGFEAGQQIELTWTGKSGNRVSGGGWEEVTYPFETVSASDEGTFAFNLSFPDHHGGIHNVQAVAGDTQLAETAFEITPSIIGIEPSSGPVGTIMHLHLKGVGWTATANNFYMVYDNTLVGYNCGFNSFGDVNVYMHAAGEPGWHFINLYPGIYKGVEEGRLDVFRLPQLTYEDHPGEKINMLSFAFYIPE